MSHEQPITVSVARTILSGYTRQANAWHMLYRFADAASLHGWEQPEERRWCSTS